MNTATLDFLDTFEGHPDFYTRLLVSVNLLKSFNDGNENRQSVEKEYQAWCYILKSFRESMLQLETLEDYRSEGEHGRVYNTE